MNVPNDKINNTTEIRSKGKPTDPPQAFNPQIDAVEVPQAYIQGDEVFATTYAVGEKDGISKENLQILQRKLWSTDFLTTLEKTGMRPLDYIIGFGIVPMPVTVVGRSPVLLGGYNTGVQLNVAQRQQTFSLASVKIERKYNNYLDFAPYTTAQIYIPYIGMRPLDVDKIMGKGVSMSYSFDCTTGAFAVRLESGGVGPGMILGEYIGNCYTPIPLSSRDSTNVFRNIISGAMSGGSMGAMYGGGYGALGGAVAGGLHAGLTTKPTVSTTGGLGSGTALLTSSQAFIQITRPNISKPENFAKLNGIPSNQWLQLGKCKGMTVVDSVRLAIPRASAEDLDLIERTLKEGIFI